VLSNPAFATDKAGWDFILVGTDYDAADDRKCGFTSGAGTTSSPRTAAV